MRVAKVLARMLAASSVLASGCIATTAQAVPCAAVTSSTEAVLFGGYDPLSSSAVDGTGSITVTCADSGDLTIASITISSGRSNSFSERTMSNGTAALGYNLYTDGSRSIVWTDSSSLPSPTSTTTNSQTFTVYGRIRGGQNTATAGTYGDTLNIIITY